MLDPVFLSCPLAHRGLHDKSGQCPENSFAALRASISHGFGMELDVQLSRDGVAMVFHDETLDRLTECDGPVQALDAGSLSELELAGSPETIPTLEEFLSQAGETPLLVEIKDQANADATEALARATCADLARHNGPVAVMSFNPHAVAVCKHAAPAITRGLTTHVLGEDQRPDLPPATRKAFNDITYFETVEASFVSHDVATLTAPPVLDLRSRGVPILCWTVRSARQESEARKIAHNITFEDYLPVLKDGL